MVTNTFYYILFQLEHSNERYKLLESSCKGFQKEAEALREKSHQLSISCAKLETSYEAAKQELSEVKEKLHKSEVQSDFYWTCVGLLPYTDGVWIVEYFGDQHWEPFTLKSIQFGSFSDRSMLALRKCSHAQTRLDRSQTRLDQFQFDSLYL